MKRTEKVDGEVFALYLKMMPVASRLNASGPGGAHGERPGWSNISLYNDQFSGDSHV
ncbi:MAG: hypothetical protein WB930_08475 [Syntrophobacteraceae bacterium]